MELFWEMSQSRRIAEAQEAAEYAKSRADQKAEATDAQLQRYEEQMERLGLICMAMWSLLKDKTDLTEADLMKRVEEIDLSDGKLDGRVRNQVSVCPHCNRALSLKHNRCLYCGFTPEGGDFAAFRYSPPPPGDAGGGAAPRPVPAK